MKSSGLAGLLLCVIVFVALGLWIINANAEDTAKAGFRSVEPFPGAPYPSDRFSDSPYMYVPDEFAQLPPELPPAKRKGVYLEDPTQTVAYNVLTGEVTTESGGASLLEGIAPSLPGPAPSWEVPPADETDGRVKITSTSSYPWRTHTKVFMEWPDNPGKYGGCSGAIVDGFHVLTAGHCVHSQDHGGWALSVIVVPGYNCGYKPYYEAYSTYLRSYNGWTEDENPEHDWALITLDRNIGNYIGWMGRVTAGTGWYEDRIFHGAGYPGALEDGKCLYYDIGVGEEAWEYYLAVDMEVGTARAACPCGRTTTGHITLPRFLPTLPAAAATVPAPRALTRTNSTGWLTG